MLIKTTQYSACKEHQVTDEKVYLERRELLKKMGFFGCRGTYDWHCWCQCF
jgi:sulfoxide reductase catalytic subunit YedY